MLVVCLQVTGNQGEVLGSNFVLGAVARATQCVCVGMTMTVSPQVELLLPYVPPEHLVR